MRAAELHYCHHAVVVLPWKQLTCVGSTVHACVCSQHQPEAELVVKEA